MNAAAIPTASIQPLPLVNLGPAHITLKFYPPPAAPLEENPTSQPEAGPRIILKIFPKSQNVITQLD